MTNKLRAVRRWSRLVIVGVVAAGPVAMAQAPIPTATHPAVGSWFGKAVQLCPSGVSPSACVGGNPAFSLFMTPTLTADGRFLGNDSLALGSAPFGPHTTAHGTWIATSSTEFIADYVFMLNTFPPPPGGAITGLRFRWAAQVISSDTIVGFVNIYFSAPLVQSWTQLLDNEFPAFPPEANVLVTAPSGVVRDPSLCRTAGCPFVFKFTIKRVTP